MFLFRQSEQKYNKMQKKMTRIKELVNKAVFEAKRVSFSSTGEPPSPNKRKSDESSQAESIREVLHNMKKGYIFTKHSINTNQPHPKFVYISEDQRFLCWKSPDKEDEKRLEIHSITSIVHEGAQRYMEACRDVKDFECCIVVVSQARNLELQAFSVMEAHMFKEELIRVMKYNRGMSFNYKYSQV